MRVGCGCPDVPVPRCVWVRRAGFTPHPPAQWDAFGYTEQGLERARGILWGCLAVGKELYKPIPSIQGETGFGWLCKMHCVNKAGLFHLLESKSTHFSTPLPQPSVRYPFAITTTWAGGCRRSIHHRLTDTPHGKPPRPCSENQPQN